MIKMHLIIVVLVILGTTQAFSGLKTSRKVFVSGIKRPERRVETPLVMATGQEGSVRPLMGGLAVLGAVETAYLTYSKIFNSPVLCATPGASCESVLSSAFSSLPFVHIPLSAVAVVAYLTVAFFSLSQTDEQASDLNTTALLALTTAMSTFSGYLLWVLAFVLKQTCMYCYASAAISFAMAILACNTKAIASNAAKTFVVQWSSFGVTLVSAIFLFYTSSLLAIPTDEAQASTAPAYQAMQMAEEEAAIKEKAPPTVRGRSSKEALALAPRLQRAGGKM